MTRAQTVWSAGRLDGAEAKARRVLFGRMYEDAGIEREAFRGRRRIFCIASAGDTALALAADHDVVACDINPVQLDYARERVSGAAVRRGAAERLMAVGRTMAAAAGWRRPVLEQFLLLRDPAAQVAFWRERLDTRRFRLGFDLLLSPRWLRLAYARPLISFLPSDFGAVLRGRLERGFARHPNAENPFAWALFAGEVPGRLAGPAAGRAVAFVESDAASFLEASPAGSFDGFALSNILDGAEEAYRVRLAAAVRRASAPGAVVVRRSFGEPEASGGGENRAAADRSLLWGVVKVESVEGLAV